MLTQAPLPTWLDLARALPIGRLDDVALSAPWRRDGEVAGWMSRSAWSLALIARWRQRQRGTTPVVAWFPDYFCNATLDPLREMGVRLAFYPLTEQLTPDLAASGDLARTAPPDLFVLVHYFGQPSEGSSTREFCRSQGAWLIEDAAHVVRPVKGVGTVGDFVVYSPHKHLPIPDGAVLVIRGEGPARLTAADRSGFGDPEGWPGQLADLQPRLRDSTSQGRRRRAVWVVKRALQKVGVRSRHAMPPYDEPVQPGATATMRLEHPAPSAISRRILAGIGKDLGVEARHQHLKEWDALLGSMGLTPASRPSAGEWTPYLAAYRVDPASAAATFTRLRAAGLPVVSWPDLPPEVTAGREGHARAWALRHSRVYLPVHRSLTVPRSITPARSEPHDA